jgi:GT2 family glycosyltransferase
MQPNCLMSHSITFIVPTLRRPGHLTRCLHSIADQTVPAYQVLVGIRSDDDESRAVIQNQSFELPIRDVEVRGTGVIGSMDSCLALCECDYIALLDDDVQIPANWTERMLINLQRNPRCVASGGRDILLDYPEHRRLESLLEDVGRIHWYGRVTGNHHRGGGSPRCVNILRGSNVLFRADFLKCVGFEKDLRGSGAQVGWEVAIALQALSSGGCMFFDPSIEVLHYVAPRHDDDSIHRGGFSRNGTIDMAFNETLAVLRYGRNTRRLMLLVWQLSIGSPCCPGILRVAEILTARRHLFASRLSATVAGRSLAFRSYFSSLCKLRSGLNERRHF